MSKPLSIMGCMVLDRISRSPKSVVESVILSFLYSLYKPNDEKLVAPDTKVVFVQNVVGAEFVIEEWGELVLFHLNQKHIAEVREIFRSSEASDDDSSESSQPTLLLALGDSTFCSQIFEFMFEGKDGTVRDGNQGMLDKITDLSNGDVIASRSTEDDYFYGEVGEMYEAAQASLM